ncbi:MAG TPA: glycoside hydrolase family 16 protein [Chloroflexota bacterium]|nr:glycoside hydrolase family 16 protein [Chloroflexota bacterium]
MRNLRFGNVRFLPVALIQVYLVTACGTLAVETLPLPEPAAITISSPSPTFEAAATRLPLPTPMPSPTPTESISPPSGPAPEPTVAATATATRQPTATPEWMKAGWTLVWQDEFDGPEINAAYWTHDTGGHGWGNAELQYYTAAATNSFIEDGMLTIQALEEAYDGRAYTSARLTTMEKVEVAYGRVEARIQLPYGRGTWPAFWMMGADFPYIGWPLSGEIDIMEHIGHEPETVYAHVHGPGYSRDESVGSAYDLGKPAAETFHVFALEWEEEEIRWYVDEAVIFTITPADVPGTWVFDHPFFLVLNLAVGGHWPGPPDETTQFPQQLMVDYIRIYKPDGHTDNTKENVAQ